LLTPEIIENRDFESNNIWPFYANLQSDRGFFIIFTLINILRVAEASYSQWAIHRWSPELFRRTQDREVKQKRVESIPFLFLKKVCVIYLFWIMQCVALHCIAFHCLFWLSTAHRTIALHLFAWFCFILLLTLTPYVTFSVPFFIVQLGRKSVTKATRMSIG